MRLARICWYQRRGGKNALPYVGPGVKDDGEPGTGIQDGPIDNRHQEWECHHGCVKDRVSGLEQTRPAGQPGLPRAGIFPGMQTTDKKIKGDSPERQIGEIREGAARFLGVTVRSIPAEDEKDGDEGVDGEQESRTGQQQRREQPRGGVSLGRIKGSVHAAGFNLVADGTYIYVDMRSRRNVA